MTVKTNYKPGDVVMHSRPHGGTETLIGSQEASLIFPPYGQKNFKVQSTAQQEVGDHAIAAAILRQRNWIRFLSGVIGGKIPV